MARKKQSRTARGQETAGSRAARGPAAVVACSDYAPGHPRTQPPLVPITMPTPGQVSMLPFKITGPAPAPAVFHPGTPPFLYYATTCALARTAAFWSAIVPSGTRWQVGKVLPVELDSGVDLNAFYTRG